MVIRSGADPRVHLQPAELSDIDIIGVGPRVDAAGVSDSREHKRFSCLAVRPCTTAGRTGVGVRVYRTIATTYRYSMCHYTF